MRVKVNVARLPVEEVEVELLSFPQGKIETPSVEVISGSAPSPDGRGLRTTSTSRTERVGPIPGITVAIGGETVEGKLRGVINEDGVVYGNIIISELALGGQSGNDKVGIPVMARFSPFGRGKWVLENVMLLDGGVVRRC